MNQEQKIKMYMEQHGSITQREAFYLGCQRLASRICDMRRKGVVINRKMVEVVNADGSKTLVARYSLGE